MVLGIEPAVTPTTAVPNSSELSRILRLTRRLDPGAHGHGHRASARPAAQHLATNVAVRVTVARPRWQSRYSRCVAATDLLALSASAVGYRWWGSVDSFTTAQIAMACSVVVAGALALYAARAWDPRVLGHGTEEFNRLVRAFVWLGLLTTLPGLALEQPALRPYAFGVVPMALVGATSARLLIRWRVTRLRRQDRCMRNVLVVGSGTTVAPVIDRARRSRAGWAVTGVCLSDDDGSIRREGGGAPRTVHGVPVLGGLEAVVDTVLRFGYHVVCVAPDTGWSSRRLHELTWDLEGTGTEIAVDPGLMEIASRRVVMCPLDGVPVLRLEEPKFFGLQRLTKAVIDRVGALLLLIALSPVLLAAALAVRCSGRGPLFYRARRLGKNGEPFTMVKFRSMVPDAEQRRAELVESDNGAGPMFKIRDDPRVTRVGRVLRRYSIDELPQLFNVLAGSMSLVGPRPPLPEEIRAYDEAARRRLLVRPGMTGLWQVSGRSDLSWVESVRLDLTYVENWSLLSDALIVVRTIRAVVRAGGAY
jgi:exopolysaccharide biosynthesis polyprenyl glycosylphosphotransferase